MVRQFLSSWAPKNWKAYCWIVRTISGCFDSNCLKSWSQGRVSRCLSHCSVHNFQKHAKQNKCRWKRPHHLYEPLSRHKNCQIYLKGRLLDLTLDLLHLEGEINELMLYPEKTSGVQDLLLIKIKTNWSFCYILLIPLLPIETDNQPESKTCSGIPRNCPQIIFQKNILSNMVSSSPQLHP